MENLAQFEADLWSAADNLRANSKLTSSDYFMPVLGIIFLRHAANRFEAAARQIADDQTAGRMPKRKILPADYIRRRALFLPEAARFDTIMAKATTDPAGLPNLVTDAMTAIEADFEPLANVLPKDYGIFEPKVLEELMRLFNSEQIKRATGDVFGRIYEYFLAKFSIQKAHDNGEFFTPSSLVQLIVNVIEPDHGTVFDPACGSGGMFVQSSHFIEQEGGDTTRKVVFYGQEKNRDTIRIAKMNLAVHGLEGKIAEAITYYQDEHNLGPTTSMSPGGCDFVMANPPFNVDLVDAERIKTDPRLPFGLPGVNKDKRVSNGNYLWISYFYSYLNEKGRAGFVMSSQASSAGNDEKAVRQKLVETGAVDVMISIRGGFFYTRTVPCELWHLDRAKPADRLDQVLMLDARSIGQLMPGSRKVYEFTPEQMRNLTAIVWLYRGQRGRFAALVRDYFSEAARGAAVTHHAAYGWCTACDGKKRLARLVNGLRHFTRDENLDEALRRAEGTADAVSKLAELVEQLDARQTSLRRLADALYDAIEKVRADLDKRPADHDQDDPKEIVRRLTKDCLPLEALEQQIAGFRADVEAFNKAVRQGADIAEKSLGARRSEAWRKTMEMPVELDGMREDEERLHEAHHLLRTNLRHFNWLVQRFPDAEIRPVPGLCRVVTRADIAAADWSLTPGRHVGVAPAEVDEDFDFGQAIAGIHEELAGLNAEAVELAATIQKNLEELGV